MARRFKEYYKPVGTAKGHTVNAGNKHSVLFSWTGMSALSE